MTKPLESSKFKLGFHRYFSCVAKNVFISHLVPQGHSNNVLQAFHLEGMQSSDLTFWMSGVFSLQVSISPPVVVYSMLHPPGVVFCMCLSEDLTHKTVEEKWRENTTLPHFTFNSELLRRFISSLHRTPCAHVYLFDDVD